MNANILLADDEPNQLELMSFNLTNAGYSIIKATNGKEAIELIENHSPDLIILDWMMPKMSGIDVCRTLRSRSETKQIPIIILSARSEDSDKSLGLDTGADDYISKPFSPKEFISRVKALLRRSKPSLVNDVLQHNGLTLSLSEMTVTYHNKNVKLGPKEFKLLTLLMERPGHVFSRSKLFYSFGINTKIHLNIFRTYVNNLIYRVKKRKAINLRKCKRTTNGKDKIRWIKI